MNVEKALQDVLKYVPTAWEVSIVRAKRAINWRQIIERVMVSINNYVSYVICTS